MASTMPARSRLSARRSGSIRLARCAGGAKRWPTAPTSTRRWTPDANALALRRSPSYAQWLAAKATPAERALTDAMVKRYSPDPDADRAALDAAYADAMLAAAALIPRTTTSRCSPPKRRWTLCRGIIGNRTSNAPSRGSARRSSWSKRCMARNPDHPQAAHLYIHLMENGPDPKRAEAAADRLATPLAPAPGTSSTCRRTSITGSAAGRIRSASTSTPPAPTRPISARRTTRASSATATIRTTSTSSSPRRKWPATCRPRSARRKRLGVAPRRRAPRQDRLDSGDPCRALFRRRAIRARRPTLAMRAPDARLPMSAACAIMPAPSPTPSSATATASTRRCAELRALRAAGRAQADGRSGRARARPAAARRNLSRAAAWPHARPLWRGRRPSTARRSRSRTSIPYMEPPFWYYPVRQSLGAALYRAGRYDEAREAFTAALAKFPNNGWALYGLASAERALGRRDLCGGAPRRRSTAHGSAIRTG